MAGMVERLRKKLMPNMGELEIEDVIGKPTSMESEYEMELGDEFTENPLDGYLPFPEQAEPSMDKETDLEATNKYLQEKAKKRLADSESWQDKVAKMNEEMYKKPQGGY